MSRFVAAVVALDLVYALALSSFHPWDLTIGATLSAALLVAARRTALKFDDGAPSSPDPPGTPDLPGRVFAFFPFAAAVGWDVLAGAWRVLLAVAGVRRPMEPGAVAVPLGERTATGIAVSAFVAALSPGTLLVGVDEHEKVMLIHALDAADPEAVRASQEEFYRRYQRRVFP